MTDKWASMKEFLDASTGQVTRTVDDGGSSVPFLAVLALARMWLDEARPAQDWATFRRRLQRAVEVMADSPDKGSVASFGLWDGLNGASSAALRLERAEAAGA